MITKSSSAEMGLIMKANMNFRSLQAIMTGSFV